MAQAKRASEAVIKTFKSKCPDFLDAIMRLLMVSRDHTEAGRIALSNRLLEDWTRCPKCASPLIFEPSTLAFDALYDECINFASNVCLAKSDSRGQAATKRTLWPLSMDQLFPFGAKQGIDSLVAAASEHNPHSLSVIGLLLWRHRRPVFEEVMEPYNRLRLLKTSILELRRFVDLSRPIIDQFSRTARAYAPGARDAAITSVSRHEMAVGTFLYFLSQGPEAAPNDGNVFARGYTGKIYHAVVDTIACFEDPQASRQLHPGLADIAYVLYTELDAVDRRDPPEFLRSRVQRSVHAHSDPYRWLWALAPRIAGRRSCYGCDKSVDDSATRKAFPQCGRCRMVRYCSPACQRDDWKDAVHPHKAICDILSELSRIVSFNRDDMNIDQFAAACEEHAFPKERAVRLAKWICGRRWSDDDDDESEDDMPIAFKELLTDTIGASEEEARGSRGAMDQQTREELERGGFSVHPATGIVYPPVWRDSERQLKALDLIAALRIL
ncbi:hypothetical protein EXIGLDRAFT_736490 [Exidia glandulosa HHB12029]|uniref:MYND-type domain-containing protein n=1 Tax=Exidia glandulosa HHB12029 TaxID=1314781 RepID=A0A166N6S7_EXIGL|nr:hypothetical protein EXIGLDRAFT_736490 [Exidia glandulosa HHB12029]